MFVRLISFALIVVAMGFMTEAQAQVREDSWRFQLTPYVWLANLSGDIRPLAGSPTVSTSRSFGEILDDLEGAFFISGSARYERWVLFGDFTYASLSHEGVIPPGMTAEGKVGQRSLTAAAGYQVMSEHGHYLDLLVGARAWRMKSEVSVPALGLGLQDTERWVDPILVARWRTVWSPAWSTLLHADVGGFGIGADSTWQVMATANYQISEALYLSAGYRQLVLHRDEEGTRLDIAMGGPLVGMTWRF
ncbi:hypothetical protein [Billgrantia ethanolica]|uniref:Outer membrane protein beta-barrel domain-containing protein n=1 Tax=Billgrantia ethanolica TaxID=2733486 RepID=A0ABS9A157_9GAMM|nr:hypothetical protein [Halomonas ethanolica]MCE8001554.1 hypothetical protein [Halomonas ethanolica]